MSPRYRVQVDKLPREFQEKELREAEEEKIREQYRRSGNKWSENDVKWGYLNKRIIETIKDKNWVWYREYRVEMAHLLEKEKKYKTAIAMWTEAFALNLNEEKTGFTNPSFVKAILKDAKNGNMSIDEVRNIFIEHYSRIMPGLNFMIPPEIAWEQFLSQRYECGTCGGSGSAQCQKCGGSRRVGNDACPTCRGAGLLKCPVCNGSGRVKVPDLSPGFSSSS